MPKVTKSMRISPKILADVEKIKEKSDGEFTLSSIVNNALRKEVAELKKIYKIY